MIIFCGLEQRQLTGFSMIRMLTRPGPARDRGRHPSRRRHPPRRVDQTHCLSITSAAVSSWTDRSRRHSWWPRDLWARSGGGERASRPVARTAGKPRTSFRLAIIGTTTPSGGSGPVRREGSRDLFSFNMLNRWVRDRRGRLPLLTPVGRDGCGRRLRPRRTRLAMR